ncbi:SAM-dependent methyltransferase [Erysipelothrix larvae]|uniref:SAM-dependent methyltransferase n=1 Tax=Erysipelothrix larvae TaxID=1514105 RepID=A0A109UGH0_9FIRM|nr:class I SAM-dependent methyltransferase [Erysipelothrix larvae]AMC92641.1 SAM-dependent methyltransferase [Erysipelothrix larvae]
MRLAKDWIEYECIDCGDGMKIERFGPYILKRKEPSWTQPLTNTPFEFNGIHTQHGWETHNLPDTWTIHYKDMAMELKPTEFKHLGIFPEQAVNWDFIRASIQRANKPLRILNLFGYTGGATIACAMENVEEVVHIDALKSAISRTQENIKLNTLEDKKIRTIVDDVMKFLAREKRRGRTYHGVILDPPSFGRGPNKEIWEIKKDLEPLLNAVNDILDKDVEFIVLNTYSSHITKREVHAIASRIFKPLKGILDTQHIGVPITLKDKPLILGQTTRWTKHENLL